jgi:hypothetical protein
MIKNIGGVIIGMLLIMDESLTSGEDYSSNSGNYSIRYQSRASSELTIATPPIVISQQTTITATSYSRVPTTRILFMDTGYKSVAIVSIVALCTSANSVMKALIVSIALIPVTFSLVKTVAIRLFSRTVSVVTIVLDASISLIKSFIFLINHFLNEIILRKYKSTE